MFVLGVFTAFVRVALVIGGDDGVGYRRGGGCGGCGDSCGGGIVVLAVVVTGFVMVAVVIKEHYS